MTDMTEIAGLTLRVQTPDGPGPHPLILMLHGLGGNEDVMWIFASRLPKNALLVAPRGLHPSKIGGYSWIPEDGSTGGQTRRGRADLALADFRPAMDALQNLLTPENFPNARLDKIGLVGFSQGAALAYSLALTYPQRVAALAGLAGFAPLDAEEPAAARPLTGRTVFITHGTQDATVPFERAQHARRVFETAGAQVILCSDDVGHKLSANCFRGLAGYFANQYGAQQDGDGKPA